MPCLGTAFSGELEFGYTGAEPLFIQSQTMRIVKLHSLSLQLPAQLCAYSHQQQARKAFAAAIEAGSRTPGHWDNDIQWAVAADLEAGAKLISAQLRERFKTRLENLGLALEHLKFSVATEPVKDGLVWATMGVTHSGFDARFGMEQS